MSGSHVTGAQVSRRIRHVLPQPSLGTLPYDPPNEPMTGLAGAAWSLAVAQAAAGHDVEIVAPGTDGAQSRRVAGVQVSWLRSWRPLRTPVVDLSHLLPLALHTARSARADIAHIHGNPYFRLDGMARASILHVQDSSIHLGRKMARHLVRYDQVVCCSNYIRQELLGRFSYPRGQTHVLPNGVEWQLHDHTDRACAREVLGVAGDQVVLLFSGRIIPDKGLMVLLSALQMIVHDASTQPLLVVTGSAKMGLEGNPDAWEQADAYEQQVRQAARNLPVRFVGATPRAQMPLLYRAADIFVCPSTYQEPLGMVNVEAQACGTPVIASAVGGIPDVVEHEVNGLLVPPGDAQALARALLRLIHDRSLRARLGTAARESSSQLDWRLLAARLDEIYDRALHGTSQVQLPGVG